MLQQPCSGIIGAAEKEGQGRNLAAGYSLGHLRHSKGAANAAVFPTTKVKPITFGLHLIHTVIKRITSKTETFKDAFFMGGNSESLS